MTRMLNTGSLPCRTGRHALYRHDMQASVSNSGGIDKSVVNEGDGIFAIDSDLMYVISGGGRRIINIHNY